MLTSSDTNPVIWLILLNQDPIKRGLGLATRQVILVLSAVD